MDFFRRPSKVGGGEITPPIQIIEELKSAIADLKDELATALEAKQYAKADLKQQLVVQERMEMDMARARQDLDMARGQLLEAIARQQAEVPVMAAPSPNGTTRIRIETDEGVEMVSVESFRERIKFLEATMQQAEGEIVSLKHINVQNVAKLKQLLSERHKGQDLETALEQATERIVELERDLSSMQDGKAGEAATTELDEMRNKISQLLDELDKANEETALVEKQLEKKTEECADFETLWVAAKAELETERDEHARTVSAIRREVEEKSLLVDTLKNDLASASESAGAVEELEQLRDAAGEYETQILELISQVAQLRSENEEKSNKITEISSQLDVTQTEADEAARRLDGVHGRIDEAREALQAAIRSSLEAKKEAMLWRTKYVTDMKLATEKLRSAN